MAGRLQRAWLYVGYVWYFGLTVGIPLERRKEDQYPDTNPKSIPNHTLVNWLWSSASKVLSRRLFAESDKGIDACLMHDSLFPAQLRELCDAELAIHAGLLEFPRSQLRIPWGSLKYGKCRAQCQTAGFAGYDHGAGHGPIGV